MSDIDWDSKDINVVYDIFYEQGTHLAGMYNALRSRARSAGDQEAVEFWTKQIRALDDERQAVGADDRAAMVSYTSSWRSLVEQLTMARRQAA